MRDDELLCAARRHTSPTFLLAVLYAGGLLCMAIGGWALRLTLNLSAPTLLLAFRLTMLGSGAGFIGDANKRLAVNRVVRELLAVAV